MTIQPDTLLSRQHIRQQIRDRRRALSPEQQRLFAQQAAERMMAWPPVVFSPTTWRCFSPLTASWTLSR